MSEGLWITRNQAALLLGCSVQTLDRQIRPRLGKKDEKGEREKKRINAPALVKVWLAHQMDLMKPATQIEIGKPEPDDGLAETRRLENHLKRLKLGREYGQLVDIEQFKTAMISGIKVFKKILEKITTKYGNEACEIVNYGITEFERSACRSIGAQESNASSLLRDLASDEVDHRRNADEAGENSGRVRGRGNNPSKRTAKRSAVQGRSNHAADVSGDS